MAGRRRGGLNAEGVEKSEEWKRKEERKVCALGS